MKFVIDRHYTRDDIHAEVGGSKQEYLPVSDYEVVAACLRRDLNPDSPDVVLPGTGRNIEDAARRFAEQRTAVPTFLKDDVNKWRYVGNYRVQRYSTDPHDIARHANGAGRTDVTQVLYLGRID